MLNLDELNRAGVGYLPGYLGIVLTYAASAEVRAELPIQPHLLAPNGYLHAGTLVSLADTACGYGCMLSLPEGANGFTTLELKSNHLSTATSGLLVCTATISHQGKTTQVWDATVKHSETDKTLALFRCTQMILYPKA
jgi:uncharacterized protein (TIGR00369 family)